MVENESGESNPSDHTPAWISVLDLLSRQEQAEMTRHDLDTAPPSGAGQSHYFQPSLLKLLAV